MRPAAECPTLQQAKTHHVAGRLTEAVKLYRRILADRPDFTEAYIHFGNALKAQGALDAAIAAYRQALVLNPELVELYINIGNTLRAQGALDEAVEAYRCLLASKPQFAPAHVNMGNVFMSQGKPSAAANAYRSALALNPGFPEAHCNLGNALMAQGALTDAASAYRSALAIRPDYAEAHNHLGTVLSAQGRHRDAATSYRQALAIDRSYAEAHANLGNALKEMGKLDEAVHAYRRAITLEPDYVDAHNRLGVTLCESHKILEAFACFTRGAELICGQVGAHPVTDGEILSHKARHDCEQRDYIASQINGHDPSSVQKFHLAHGDSVAGPAINLSDRVNQVETQWRQSRPQIVVVDNFLSEEALEKLRRFCWESTIWREAFKEGYLGALPEHGVACPLLAQIAHELRAACPDIFRDYPLLYLWAFKYDSQLTGINVHADKAAINVNFWITPDEANLDPESGGLVIWDVSAPPDWDFAKYNGDTAAIRDFLAATGARPTTVPYRANRAVIFDSDLFHETDRLSFQNGYLNRRINLTLLYGHRTTGDNAGESSRV